jgi:predicted adenylyl cyclase CyaB
VSETGCRIITQEDFFFTVPTGRLKLRILEADHGELIFYQRPDTSDIKQCDYVVAPVADCDSLRKVLEQANGLRGRVKKRRLLFLVGQTRIHLDEVEKLGRYLELEYVLKPGESNTRGEEEIDRLMRHLGIEKEDLVEKAYIDLVAPPG